MIQETNNQSLVAEIEKTIDEYLDVLYPALEKHYGVKYNENDTPIEETQKEVDLVDYIEYDEDNEDGSISF